MSKKYPMLAALRAARERHEAELREPVQNALNVCGSRLRETQAALRGLERIVGSKIGEHVVRDISARMSEAVRRQIMEAVAKAYRAGASGPPSLIELRLSSGDVAWLDPESVERRVLDEWKHQTAPKLNMRVVTDGMMPAKMDVTVLDVRVPELGYRQHIANSAF